jgi:hypothetical protein
MVIIITITTITIVIMIITFEERSFGAFQSRPLPVEAAAGAGARTI